MRLRKSIRRGTFGRLVAALAAAGFLVTTQAETAAHAFDADSVTVGAVGAVYVGEPFDVAIALPGGDSGALQFQILCPSSLWSDASQVTTLTCPAISRPGDYPVSALIWSTSPSPTLVTGIVQVRSLLPYPTLSAARSRIAEGPGATFVVTASLDQPAPAPLSVDVTVSPGGNYPPVAGVDFVMPADPTVRFAPGEQSREIVIEVLDDDIYEYADFLLVDFVDPSAGLAVFDYAPLALFIDDDEQRPTLSMSIPDDVVVEGDFGQRTPVDIVITASGKSQGPLDFGLFPSMESGDYAGADVETASVSMPAEALSHIHRVFVVGDSAVEPDEVIEFFGQINNFPGPSLVASLTIVNDDLPISVTANFPTNPVGEEFLTLQANVSPGAILPLTVEVDHNGDGYYDSFTDRVNSLTPSFVWEPGDDRFGPYSPSVRVTDAGGNAASVKSSPIQVLNSAPYGTISAKVQGPGPFGVVISDVVDGWALGGDSDYTVRVRCDGGRWSSGFNAGSNAYGFCDRSVSKKVFKVEVVLTDDQGASRTLRRTVGVQALRPEIRASVDGVGVSTVFEGSLVELTAGAPSAVGGPLYQSWELSWDDDGDGVATVQSAWGDEGQPFDAPSFWTSSGTPTGAVFVSLTLTSLTHQVTTTIELKVASRAPTGRLTLTRNDHTGVVTARVSNLRSPTDSPIALVVYCGDEPSATGTVYEPVGTQTFSCGVVAHGTVVVAGIFDAAGYSTTLSATVRRDR